MAPVNPVNGEPNRISVPGPSLPGARGPTGGANHDDATSRGGGSRRPVGDGQARANDAPAPRQNRNPEQVSGGSGPGQRKLGGAF